MHGNEGLEPFPRRKNRNDSNELRPTDNSLVTMWVDVEETKKIITRVIYQYLTDDTGGGFEGRNNGVIPAENMRKPVPGPMLFSGKIWKKSLRSDAPKGGTKTTKEIYKSVMGKIAFLRILIGDEDLVAAERDNLHRSYGKNLYSIKYRGLPLIGIHTMRQSKNPYKTGYHSGKYSPY